MEEIKTYTIREAANKFSQLIKDAKEEGGIVVTNRGIPDALVIPLSMEGLQKFYIKMSGFFNESEFETGIKGLSPEFQTFFRAFKNLASEFIK